jgi:hypothetical protein
MGKNDRLWHSTENRSSSFLEVVVDRSPSVDSHTQKTTETQRIVLKIASQSRQDLAKALCVTIQHESLPEVPSRQHDALQELLKTLPSDPHVHPLSCEIPGHPSFFPGGRGYVGPNFPERAIMLLGNNFGDKGYVESCVQLTHEDPTIAGSTWRNLRDHVLPEAAGEAAGVPGRMNQVQTIEPECFFTNVYLGAIIHKEPKPGKTKKKGNMVPFTGAEFYQQECIRATREQVAIVRPSVIALLGEKIREPFSQAFPHSRDMLDRPEGEKLELLPGLIVQVICLVHPANPRGFEEKREQGRKLAAAIRASRD